MALIVLESSREYCRSSCMWNLARARTYLAKRAKGDGSVSPQQNRLVHFMGGGELHGRIMAGQSSKEPWGIDGLAPPAPSVHTQSSF